MKPLLQRKPTILPLFIAGVLACFGLLPKALAVVPPPDGGYPNFNTAEGQNALFNLTTGAGNTAVGWFSLFSDTTGSFNTATGAGALLFNTADQNTAFGAAALLFNTNGLRNTAVGASALLNNSGFAVDAPNGLLGSNNTAVGASALSSNTTGGENTATGALALSSNTIGFNNTAVGAAALSTNTEGENNTATGSEALPSNTTGGNNTANGTFALFSNTEGSFNTAIGFNALLNETLGNFNTAIGAGALAGNTGGFNNTAIGGQALANATGSNNIALGSSAGFNLAAGSGNIHIGNGGVNDDSNTIRVGDGQTRAFIAGISGVNQGNNSTAVFINIATGQLGTTQPASSRRFKKEIQPMEQTSEAILSLKPVMFHYKDDNTGTAQFGLIAEEVAEINPDLVVRNADGEIYSVRYDAVNAMLLNEFLKEHNKVEKLEATIAKQHKDFEAALADLKGQIQKVSAQLELRKTAPETVLNNQ